MRRRPGRRGGAPGPGRGGRRGRAAAGRASAPPWGNPPALAPRLLSGPRPRGRTPRWTSRASRLPLELPPLHREFPGLLLNFNFECSSGRCLRFLPVPHFPRPRPANEGATQQQSRAAAARPPAPRSPLPRLPRRPPRLGAALSDRTRPRVRAFGGSLPAAFAGVWGGCLLRGRRGLAAALKLAGEGRMRREPPQPRSRIPHRPFESQRVEEICENAPNGISE